MNVYNFQICVFELLLIWRNVVRKVVFQKPVFPTLSISRSEAFTMELIKYLSEEIKLEKYILLTLFTSDGAAIWAFDESDQKMNFRAQVKFKIIKTLVS